MKKCPQPKCTQPDLWNSRARFGFYYSTRSEIRSGNTRPEPNPGRLKLPKKKKKPNSIHKYHLYQTLIPTLSILLSAIQLSRTLTLTLIPSPTHPHFHSFNPPSATPSSPPSTLSSSPFPLSLGVDKLSPTLSLSLMLATQSQPPFSQALHLSVSLFLPAEEDENDNLRFSSLSLSLSLYIYIFCVKIRFSSMGICSFTSTVVFFIPLCEASPISSTFIQSCSLYLLCTKFSHS